MLRLAVPYADYWLGFNFSGSQDSSFFQSLHSFSFFFFSYVEFDRFLFAIAAGLRATAAAVEVLQYPRTQPPIIRTTVIEQLTALYLSLLHLHQVNIIFKLIELGA